MDKMEQLVTKTFLQNTRLKLLENWSVQYLLESKFSYNDLFELVQIGSFLRKSRLKILIEDDKIYQRVTVKINNKGIGPRDSEIGKNIGTKQQYLVKSGQFLMSKIDARNGAFGLVPENLEGAIVTNDFPVFDVNKSVINPEFLVLITTTKEFIKFAQSCSSGTTNRQRIDIDLFLNVKIPLPSLPEQNRIVDAYKIKIKNAKEQLIEVDKLEKSIEEYLYQELGIERELREVEKVSFKIISYSKLNRWDFKDISNLTSKYPIKKIKNVLKSISTGTTPPTSRKEYFENGTINFYTPADLGEEMHLVNSERKVTQIAFEEKKARLFKKGTLLFVGIGSTIGKVGIISNDFATSNQQITGLEFDKEIIDLGYIYYFFKYFKHITIKEKTQATIPIVNQDKIQNIPVPLPEIEIQKRIAENINGILREVKELKTQAQINIEQAIKEFENEIFNPCN
jgi:type I restriction enzyme, S subunit